MNGQQIADAIAPYAPGGQLSLGTGHLGAGIDGVLTAWFGGTLTAGLPAPQVGQSSARYPGATLHTAGFALYQAAATVSADLVFADDGSGVIQLTVAAHLPGGYRLADSWPVIAAQAAASLGALQLRDATLTVGHGLPAATVGITATAVTAAGLLAAVDWLFAIPPVLTGTATLVTSGATVIPEFRLSSPAAAAPAIGGLGLSVSVTLLSTAAGPEPATRRLVTRSELTAVLTAGAITIPVTVSLQPGESLLGVRLDPLRPAPQVTGLTELSTLAGGADPAALISTDTPVGTLSLDDVGFTLDTRNRTITNLRVAVGLGTDWPVIPGYFELKGLTAVLTVPNLYQPAQVSVTVTAALAAGTGTIDAYVTYPDKIVGAVLQPGSSIDLTGLLRTFAGGASLPGAGSFAIAAFSARADIANSAYSLAFEVDGSLTVIPSFVLEQLSFSVSFAGGKLDSLAFGSLFAIASTELYLAAAYGGTSWVLSGGTYQQSTVNLTDLAEDLLAIFGLRLPAGLPEITLSQLELANYDTGTGDFTFSGTLRYFDPSSALLKAITGTLTITRAAAARPAWTGSVKGQAVIGSSTFTVSYDFAKTQTVSFGWQLAKDAAPFGIASLCTLLGVAPPAIPRGLDLGLDQAAFSYDRASGAVLLDAHSVNYGYAVFQSETIGGARVWAFGVSVPLHVTLADIPLVGDKLPDADQLGIGSLGVWLVSRGLAKAEVEQLNQANTAPAAYPRLPEGDIAATATFFGTLLLGSSTQPIAVPAGQPAVPPAPAALPPGGQPPPVPSAPAAPPADQSRWFPVEKTFGVFTVHRIGVQYLTDGSNTLFVALDAEVALGPVRLAMLGLALGSPLTSFQPRFQLRGLGLSYAAPPLLIQGALYALPASQLGDGVAFQYDGVITVQAEKFGLAAIGSYAQEKDGSPSLFVFAQLRLPLGGPPAFFVTGLMGGFGFNRSLTLPAQNEVLAFPLLALTAPAGPGQLAPGADPAQVLGILEGTIQPPGGGPAKAWIAPRAGEYWLAAGLQFTSFELVDSSALVVAEFGTEFAVAILGLSTLRLPQQAPNEQTYVYVELELEAVLKPADGFFGLTAVLSPNSYVLAPAAKLTGGFAFCLWFGGNPEAGQFVITIGGYHPAFTPPPAFPTVPPVGLNWAVSDLVSVKGSAYFALTNSCVMAGGGLEILFRSGNLSAWFTAQANLLVSWKPFSFLADIGVSIGVSYKLDVFGISKTLTLSIGASLSMWGPPTGGTVTVHLYIVSFTVDFGAGPSKAGAGTLTAPQFAPLLPAAPVSVTVTGGLTSSADDPAAAGRKIWIVRTGGFSFATESAVPAATVGYGGTTQTAVTTVPTGHAVDVRPMGLTGTPSAHTVRVQRTDDGTWYDLMTWSPRLRNRPVPASLWGAPLTDGSGKFTQVPPRPTADLVPGAPVGAEFTLPGPRLGATTGLVGLDDIACEPVTPPGQPGVAGQSPLTVSVTPAAGFLPSFSATSLAQVAQVAAGTAADGRTALLRALHTSGLFGGTSDPMTDLARAADHLFTDPPLLVP